MQQPLPTPKPLSSLSWKEQTYMPNLGQFIIFTLDAETTLSQHADMDEMAIEEAKAIPNKQYAGFVTFPADGPIAELPARKITLLPIAGSPPMADAENFLDPSMCIPILPTTHHPSGRRAIRLTSSESNPFPWPSVYHHSLLRYEVLAKTEFVPKPARKVSAEPADTGHIRSLQGQDCSTREKAWEAAGKPPLGLPLRLNGTLFEEPHHYPQLYYPEEQQAYPTEIFVAGGASWIDDGTLDDEGYSDDRHSSNYSYHSTEYSFMSEDDDYNGDEDDDTGSAMCALESVLSFSDRIFDSDPIVSVGYDLTVVPELVDPLGFLEEMKELNAIMHRSRDRAYKRLKEILAAYTQDHQARSPTSAIPLSLHTMEHTTVAEPPVTDSKPALGPETKKMEAEDLPAPSCFEFLSSWLRAKVKPIKLSWSRLSQAHSRLPTACPVVASEKPRTARPNTLATVKKRVRKLRRRIRLERGVHQERTKGFKFDYNIT